LRRGRWPLDEARSHIRDTVEREILLYNFFDAWGGEAIPLEFVRQLRALADRQTRLTGRPIPVAEIRFLAADGDAVATLRQRLDTPPP